MATKDNTYIKIDKLFSELGTAESHRQELVQEVSDLEAELDAIDTMLDDAADRSEYDAIRARIDECSLDLRFARNRLRRFDQSPRIDPETLADLLNQLDGEADAAAERYRAKVEKPLEAIVDVGDEFDQTIHRIREAVGKLRSVQGPVVERDASTRQAFEGFELGKLRARAYADGSLVHPDFRDALRLAASAKQEPFHTC